MARWKLWIASLLLSCSGLATAGEALQVDGASLGLEAGWTITGPGAARRALGAGVLDVVLKPVRPAAAQGPDIDVLRATEKAKEAELNASLEWKSLHFDHQRRTGVVCLHYDGKFVPRAPGSAADLVWREGLVCRHPQALSQVVEAEFSWRAPDQADASDALDAGRRLLGELRFVPPAGR